MAAGSIEVDPYRSVVFPNRIREQRLAAGYSSLLGFGRLLPDIPYVRLSKIERGEVFARADELARIADAIGVPARTLLIDVEAADFNIALWYAPFADGSVMDDPEELRRAVLLAAALRRQREIDPSLTSATLATHYGLAPVIVSRVENAIKGPARWSSEIIAALCRVLQIADPSALPAKLDMAAADDSLRPYLGSIPGVRDRIARTVARVAALTADLQRGPIERVPPPRTTAVTGVAARLGLRVLPVLGRPGATAGTLTLDPAGGSVEAPPTAGADAFAVRVCRATLGVGLPSGAVVVVDPGRHPAAGGLALVKDGTDEQAVHRIVAVIVDRDGALHGCSHQPPFEVALDTLPAGHAAAIVAAYFP